TDEHVSSNALCKRFDEGTSLMDVATHWIKEYYANYDRHNRRNGRLNFSLYGDAAYARGILNTFVNLRLMYEQYERIKAAVGLSADSPAWETIAWLKEYRDVARQVAWFFVDVLVTPDLTCQIASYTKAKNGEYRLAGIRFEPLH